MGAIRLQTIGERMVFGLAAVLIVLLGVVLLMPGGSHGKALPAGDLSTVQPVASQEQILRTRGDLWEPSIAADDKGNVYAMGLRIRDVRTRKGKAATKAVSSALDEGGGESEAAERSFRRTAKLVVMRSHDDGATWSAPREIGTPGSYDQRLDTDAAGRLYGAWLDASNNLLFARSGDHGRTFSVRRMFHAEGIDKVELAVSANGRHVYVATGVDQGGTRKTLIFVSQSGGRSFNAPVTVFRARTRSLAITADLRFKPATGSVTSDLTVTPDGHVVLGLWTGRLTVSNDHTGTDQCRGCHYVLATGDRFGRNWRVQTLQGVSRDRYGSIALAADAKSRVYALYPTAVEQADYPAYHLVLRVSTDGGRHFGPALRVDPRDDTVQRRYPFLAARDDGRVFAGWVDNSSAEDHWNMWGAYSRDAGATFTSPMLLSNAHGNDETGDPNGFGLFFGHYGELAWTASGVHAIWSEGSSFEGTTGEFNGQLYDSGFAFTSTVKLQDP
jgi:hypothetical protein